MSRLGEGVFDDDDLRLFLESEWGFMVMNVSLRFTEVILE